MNIENITIKEAKQKLEDYKELQTLFNLKEEVPLQKDCAHPFQIGKAYFIRTVTMTIVGKLEKVFKDELVLSSASWIADSGRFSDALKEGLYASSTSEIEPFNPNEDVIIGRGSLVDATIWEHDLPTKQK